MQLDWIWFYMDYIAYMNARRSNMYKWAACIGMLDMWMPDEIRLLVGTHAVGLWQQSISQSGSLTKAKSDMGIRIMSWLKHNHKNQEGVETQPGRRGKLRKKMEVQLGPQILAIVWRGQSGHEVSTKQLPGRRPGSIHCGQQEPAAEKSHSRGGICQHACQHLFPRSLPNFRPFEASNYPTHQKHHQIAASSQRRTLSPVRG